MSTDRRIFLCGGLVYAALTSLIQDYYGKEDYIRSIEEYWVDPVITVPGAIILLVVGLYFGRKN